MVGGVGGRVALKNIDLHYLYVLFIILLSCHASWLVTSTKYEIKGSFNVVCLVYVSTQRKHFGDLLWIVPNIVTVVSSCSAAGRGLVLGGDGE